MITLILPAVAIPLAVAGIGAAAGMYANWRNNRNQRKQNEKDRAFQEDMYDKQRQDSLEDWQLNNQYNHPLQQMNRLRQAGLNPHLVYGKGAENTAVMARASSASAPNQQAPQMDMSSVGSSLSLGLNTYQAIQQANVQKAQTDNINANTQVQVKDAMLKELDMAQKSIDTARSRFEYQQALELKDSIIKRAKLENIKLEADIKYTLDNNERQKLLTNQSLSKGIEEILQLRYKNSTNELERERLQETINNIKNTNTLQNLDIALEKMGIPKNSDIYQRIIGRILSGDYTLLRNAKRTVQDLMQLIPSLW